MGANSSELEKASAGGPSVTLSAYNRIPYALLNQELSGDTADVLAEFGEIMEYYKIYKTGIEFKPEGSAASYVPSTLRYRKTASLINKEVRFLFGQAPEFTVDPEGDVGKISQDAKDEIQTYQNLIDKVLIDNKFGNKIIKAAKDCFIGKRVAWVVNFSEDSGVTINFLPATQFIYETNSANPDEITKIVLYQRLEDRLRLEDRRIFKKKFVLEERETPDEHGRTKICYLEEMLYDGTGALLEEITPYQETMLDFIPAGVIVNDGLTGEFWGESEVEWLKDYEERYSFLSNADIDSLRKGMNGVKWTRDMSPTTTKNLSTAPGSYWDLQTDQNLDNPSPDIGILEQSMNYSTTLAETLARIKAAMYEQIDMPDVSLESMTSVITSGKALKAIYWPLIVRCNEKMTSWGPSLIQMAKCIIEGAIVYPRCILKHVDDVLSPVGYDIRVENPYSLPEDEDEEKANDLAEVSGQVRSRKSYMKKWFKLSDKEVEDELNQIALEQQMLNNNSFQNFDEVDFSGMEETTDDIPGEESETDEEDFGEDTEEDIEGQESLFDEE